MVRVPTLSRIPFPPCTLILDVKPDAEISTLFQLTSYEDFGYDDSIFSY